MENSRKQGIANQPLPPSQTPINASSKQYNTLQYSTLDNQTELYLVFQAVFLLQPLPY